MKKLTTLFLLALLPLMVSAQQIIEDVFYYYLNSDTKEAALLSSSSKYTGSIVIPESVVYEDVTYSVTAISHNAFSCCSGLTSVTIPYSLISIASYDS